MTSSPYSDSHEPQHEFDSPFLNETVFADEAAARAAQTWETRRVAFELESPFLQAFEQGQEATVEPEVEELEEFINELDEEEFDEEAEEEALAEFWTAEKQELESEVVWERPNKFNEKEFEEEKEVEELLDELNEEINESFWRVRPPVRYQANRYICWAEAISSWSIVTKGVRKFKKGQEVIDYFRPLRVVNSNESLKLPKGMEEIQRTFSLKFKKFEGGGSLSAINIAPLLKHSHLIVIFKRPGADYFHFIVVYGVDRFHICFMDPELNPDAAGLDRVKKNRVCARVENFGVGAEEFFIFWKERIAEKETLAELWTAEALEPELSRELLAELDEEIEAELDEKEAIAFTEDEISVTELVDNKTGSQKEKLVWYQTFLKVVEKEDLVIDGIWGNRSKAATNRLQKKYNLEIGKISPQTTLAVIQLSLEWIYMRKINNRIGTRSQDLKEAIKKFQRDYHLTVDGAVGAETRAAMIAVFNKEKPRQVLYSSSKCESTLILNNRTRVADINDDPYRWVCLLQTFMKDPDTGQLIKSSNGNLRYGVGTGFLISSKHILTAAHNLHKVVIGSLNSIEASTAQRVDFYPGDFSDKITNCAREIFVPDKWKKSAQESGSHANWDHRYDFALIKLKDNISINLNGHWELKIDPDLPQRYKEFGPHIDDIFWSGYPCDQRSSSTYSQWQSKGSGQFIENGLIFCNGDAAQGNSGGPIWVNRQIGEQNLTFTVGVFTGIQGESFWQQPIYIPVEATNLLRGVFLSPTVLKQIVQWDSHTFDYVNGKLIVKK